MTVVAGDGSPFSVSAGSSHVVMLVTVAFATADLTAGAWDPANTVPALERHLAEIKRISRASLFVPTILLEEA